MGSVLLPISVRSFSIFFAFGCNMIINCSILSTLPSQHVVFQSRCNYFLVNFFGKPFSDTVSLSQYNSIIISGILLALGGLMYIFTTPIIVFYLPRILPEKSHRHHTNFSILYTSIIQGFLSIPLYSGILILLQPFTSHWPYLLSPTATTVPSSFKPTV